MARLLAQCNYLSDPPLLNTERQAAFNVSPIPAFRIRFGLVRQSILYYRCIRPERWSGTNGPRQDP